MPGADVIVVNDLTAYERIKKIIGKSKCKAVVVPKWISQSIDCWRAVLSTPKFLIFKKMKRQIRESNAKERTPVTSPKAKRKQENINLSKWECMRPTPDICENQNLVEALKVLQEQRYLIGEQMNSDAYARAIASIKSYPKIIDNINQIKELPNVGEKIHSLLIQFIETGKINMVNGILNNENYKILKLFCGIHGVGPTTAGKWLKEGHKTLEDVEKHVKLNNAQKIGLKYYHDFNEFMTTEEAMDIFETIKKQILNLDEGFVVTAVGGLRRKKESHNDIDILVTHPKGLECDLLDELIPLLTKKDVVVETIVHYDGNIGMSSSSDNHFDHFNKWYGVVKSPLTGKYRRLDLVMTTTKEYPFALLGWTGSKMFEKSIRRYAAEIKNCKLTSHHLLDLSKNEMVECQNEEEIFEYLGFPNFVHPEFRNC
ncbi:Nucleotidyltransferase [Rozella allomycis CSF55]|uniref:DNA-directed DNA polymerase n=1 Tax=Rozella allomycis (strain CSF55) TaxID=988480 RepID=A0A4P9YKY4_ROZAC|nr:Nucleotidyltransferase [Rozella allomycis CSF55]